MSRVPSALISRAMNALRSHCAPGVAVLILAVLWAAPVTGQTIATNFEELRLKVKAGDTVYITDDSGRAEQEARILDLTESTLAVSIDRVRRDLVESRVKRIRQRLPDSRKNGALIGSLVGDAGSTAGAVATASPSGSCKGGCVGVNVLFGGGVGALAGFGIDAVIQSREDIYLTGPRQSSWNVGVHPLVLSHAKGLNISLQF